MNHDTAESSTDPPHPQKNLILFTYHIYAGLPCAHMENCHPCGEIKESLLDQRDSWEKEIIKKKNTDSLWKNDQRKMEVVKETARERDVKLFIEFNPFSHTPSSFFISLLRFFLQLFLCTISTFCGWSIYSSSIFTN